MQESSMRLTNEDHRNQRNEFARVQNIINNTQQSELARCYPKWVYNKTGKHYGAIVGGHSFHTIYILAVSVIRNTQSTVSHCLRGDYDRDTVSKAKIMTVASFINEMQKMEVDLKKSESKKHIKINN